jgi:hypothetical protein
MFVNINMFIIVCVFVGGCIFSCVFVFVIMLIFIFIVMFVFSFVIMFVFSFVIMCGFAFVFVFMCINMLIGELEGS